MILVRCYIIPQISLVLVLAVLWLRLTDEEMHDFSGVLRLRKRHLYIIITP
jgi:hypothetical protein